jgi:hypothetical protein
VFGCVVRVESTEQDLRRVMRASLAGGATRVFPTREVAVAGTCDRERSQGGVSSWDEAPGWEVLRWHGVSGVPSNGKRLPLVKISCLVTLRTDVSCGPGLRKPYTLIHS